MRRVLVIPSGADPGDEAFQAKTWQEVAEDNQCDGIEPEGGAWCVANGVTGLGIVTETVPVP